MIYNTNLKYKHILLTCLSFIVFSMAIINNTTNTIAASWPTSPTISCESAILLNADTGAILYSKDENKSLSPLGLTTIMTGLLALEYQKQTNLVCFSENATNNSSLNNNLNVPTYTTLSMRDCLHAMLLKSSNDASIAIAERISISTSSFVKMMNNKAKNLCMTKTSFTNVYGEDDKKNKSTAYDLALLTKAAIRNEDYLSITCLTEYLLDPSLENVIDTHISNTNNSLFEDNKDYDNRVISGKTGFDNNNNGNLITVAKHNGTTLISVILGCKQSNIFKYSKTLFDYGYNNFKDYDITDLEKRTFTNNAVHYLLPKPAIITIPNGMDVLSLSTSINIINDTDSKQANLKYNFKDHFLGELLLTKDGVEKQINDLSIDGKELTKPQSKTFIEIILKIFSYIYDFFIYILITIIIILIILFSLRAYLTYKKQTIKGIFKRFIIKRKKYISNRKMKNKKNIYLKNKNNNGKKPVGQNNRFAKRGKYKF